VEHTVCNITTALLNEYFWNNNTLTKQQAQGNVVFYKQVNDTSKTGFKMSLDISVSFDVLQIKA
jgi:hypothetical protein